MRIVSIEYKDFLVNGYFFQRNIHKGNILVCPAMGVEAKRYIYFAQYLYECGYNILLVDYPGVGISLEPARNYTLLTLTDWANCITSAGKWLRATNGFGNCYFIGHSIGSQLFGFIKDITLFDKAIFIASSTGYWKDLHQSVRISSYLKLKLLLPLLDFFFGKINAQLLKAGDNFPSGPALQWRKWCLRVNYCIPDIPETEKNNFNAYSKEIVSIWFYDDPVANEKTVRKLLHCFKAAELQVIKIDTETKIGHTGFVSRSHQENVWNIIRKSI